MRIPFLMFWLGSSPSDFHKTSEGHNCLIKEDQYKNNNIFGRHASNCPNIKRNFASKGDIDFSVSKFRFCDKYKRPINTSEGNRVFGVSDKFSKHGTSLDPGKSFGCPKQMYGTYSITKDHNYGINQASRKNLVHCSGSASRENLVQVLATARNSGSERKKFLSNQNKAKRTFTGRLEVVEGEFTS